jgi:hypothetical protein
MMASTVADNVSTSRAPLSGNLSRKSLCLTRLDTSQRLPRLFFTETGLAGLRAMMADRRLADPKTFAHIQVNWASIRTMKQPLVAPRRGRRSEII